MSITSAIRRSACPTAFGLIVLGIIGSHLAIAAEPPGPLIGTITTTDDKTAPMLVVAGPKAIGPIRLWVPESIFGVPGAAAIYPQGGEWTQRDGVWRQTVDDRQLFAPGSVRALPDRKIEFHKLQLPLEGPVHWETEVRPDGDAVTFTIRLTNSGPQAIHHAGAAVCIKFLSGKWWSDDRVFVLSDGRVQPLADLGRTESRFYKPNPFQLYLVRGEKFDNEFYHAVWGVNGHTLDHPVMVSENRDAGLCVEVSASQAYFLHCNRGNPCTDMMLALGDLEPGKSAIASGMVRVVRSTAAELLKTPEK